MIKYITFAYAIGNVGILTSSDFCEIKDLQSPYVEKIDDASETISPYVPVDTCTIDTTAANIDDAKDALMRCIKMRTHWRKI